MSAKEKIEQSQEYKYYCNNQLDPIDSTELLSLTKNQQNTISAKNIFKLFFPSSLKSRS